MTVSSPEAQTVTRLLQECKDGNAQAFDELIPIVYGELRRLAAEKPGHTLPATALVHEAYFRLVDSDIAWQNRAHFYAIVPRVLRRVLVELAKAGGRQKRGGGAEKYRWMKPWQSARKRRRW